MDITWVVCRFKKIVYFTVNVSMAVLFSDISPICFCICYICISLVKDVESPAWIRGNVDRGSLHEWSCFMMRLVFPTGTAAAGKESE